MRTCSSFAVRRHFLPISLSHRPVSCSLIHSCSVLAASTESPVQFDSQPAVVPIHKSSPIPPTPTSSLASSTTQHSERLQHAPALTVLHTTRELIARILPPESLELSFWNKVLCEVSDEITRSSLTSKQDSATIVGALQVVTPVGLALMHRSQFIPWMNFLEGNRSWAPCSKIPSLGRWKMNRL
jgi:hypothetical protein